MDSCPYNLLTSFRYDPFLRSLRWNDDEDGPSEFMLLPYHFDRLSRAASLHAWDVAASTLTQKALKATCRQAVVQHQNIAHENAYKIRVTLSQNGVLKAEASPVPSLTADPTALVQATLAWSHGPDSTLTIGLDTQSTSTSIFTFTKTTQRLVYDAARTRNGLVGVQGRSGPDNKITDVLLWNDDLLLTETTIYNIALYRNSSWVTPPLSTGCLPGVFRRWLLEQGFIRESERPLGMGDVKEGEPILLFNGVQGCRLGRIRAQECFL